MIADPHTKGTFFDFLSKKGAARVGVSLFKDELTESLFVYTIYAYALFYKDVHLSHFTHQQAYFRGCVIETEQAAGEWLFYLKKIDPYMFIGFTPPKIHIEYEHSRITPVKLSDSFIDKRISRSLNDDPTIDETS